MGLVNGVVTLKQLVNKLVFVSGYIQGLPWCMISTSVPYKRQRNQFNRCNILGSLSFEFQQILFLAAECLYEEESLTLLLLKLVYQNLPNDRIH